MKRTKVSGSLASAPRVVHPSLPWVLSILMVSVFAIGFYLILGVWGVLPAAVFGALPARSLSRRSHCRTREKRWRLKRVLPEGILIGRDRGGRREALLRWADIEKVKLCRLWGFVPFPPLSILLLRRQSFWTFGRNEMRRYRFIWTTWRRRAFREALKQHLSADQVDPHVWDLPIPQDDRGFRWVSGVVLILLGLLLAVVSFSTIWSLQMSAWWVMFWPLACMPQILIAFGIVIRTRMLRGSGGFISALLFVSLMVILMGGGMAGRIILSWPAWLGIHVGWAALLVAVGFYMFLVPHRPSVKAALPVLLMAVLGFFVGWQSCGGIPVERFSSRSIAGIADPWTPGGDAFVLERSSPMPLDESGSASADVGIAWYRADGSLVREVALGGTWNIILAVAQEAALVDLVAVDHRKSLRYVTRQGEIRELLLADRIRPCDGMTSSNGRWVTLEGEWGDTEEDYRAVWYRVDMHKGTVQELSFPHPHQEVTNVAVDDKGALLWLNGSLAKPNEHGDYRPGQPLPAPETFDEPGRPFSLWYDDSSDDRPPVELHSGNDVWLDYKVVDNMRRVYATRLVLEPEPHREYVCLCVDGQNVSVEPTTANYDIEKRRVRTEDGEGVWSPKEKNSPDGRFTLEYERAYTVFPGCRLWIKDTRTGRRRSVRSPVNFWGDAYFSPDGRWLLAPSWRAVRNPWSMGFLSAYAISRDTLLVDLDKAFSEGE